MLSGGQNGVVRGQCVESTGGIQVEICVELDEYIWKARDSSWGKDYADMKITMDMVDIGYPGKWSS